MAEETKFNLALSSATHTTIQHSLRGHRVLRFSGPNHVNPHVHPTRAYLSLSPSNSEPPQAALVVILGEVS
jgi:hypothetical protein